MLCKKRQQETNQQLFCKNTTTDIKYELTLNKVLKERSPIKKFDTADFPQFTLLFDAMIIFLEAGIYYVPL